MQNRERERVINLQQQSIIEQGIVVAWWKKRSKPSFVVLHIGTVGTMAQSNRLGLGPVRGHQPIRGVNMA